MKLDDGYFENKFRAIMAAYHADLITKIDDILKQIARDAAEAQRSMSTTTLEDLYCNVEHTLDDAIAAVRAAKLAIPASE